MRDVAVVAFAQTPLVRRQADYTEPGMILPVVNDVYEQAGLQRSEIDFVVSGSADYLAGQSFAFIQGLDGVGAWPPISESHVEMDGAWALYEAWMMLQIGHADTALVYGFGKSSSGNLREVLTTQLDPYYLAPTGIDCVATAAMQARALLERSDYTERDMAEVASRSRRAAMNNPYAQVRGDVDATQLLDEPFWVDPLRKHDCPPITDGAAAVVLVAGDRAKDSCERPGWIRGIEHRIEPHYFGTRDLTQSPSTAACGQKLGSPRRHRGGRALQQLHPPGADPARRARPRRRHRHQPIRRTARRQPAHGHRPHPGGRGVRPDPQRRQAPGAGPRHLRPLPATEPRLRPGG